MGFSAAKEIHETLACHQSLGTLLPTKRGFCSVASSTPSVELDKVSMFFGAKALLHQVSLQVWPGEGLVILGPSGQGKSVLLKIMSGVLAPSMGRVLIQGEDLHRLSGANKANVLRKMGMLFQKNALFDSMTVSENIAFPLREVTGLSEEKVAQKVSEFLEAVQIAHARNLFPSEISGGMQKRLGIARALALDPKIIFYDDPTAGLDPITSRHIVDLILRLKQANGATMVAVTNDMARAYQMADRIVMVVDGGVVETGSVEATKAHKDPRIHQFIRGLIAGPLTEDF